MPLLAALAASAVLAAPSPGPPLPPDAPSTPSVETRQVAPQERPPPAGANPTARVLTGLGVLAGGALLLFYGRLWPRAGKGDWSAPIRRRES
ncbi:hypothetical protein [Actinomadura rupiterrae]|uniref:hypothetical protein n=1 Tax=Actinomadura rupiterrae TaxID=559627 RepID=UPI0020A52F03|nr:hypothetical protein [Actinomadura rupiterrae]MCP2334949.1 hypothetical protein [Actinomadura rupiterrae]